jgi:hypothetical protein
MMALTWPAPHGVARFVTIAAFALAVASIFGARTVTTAGAGTTAGADTQPPPAPAATLLGDDAAPDTDTVGVQPPRGPAVGRAASVPTVRSVAPAVAALAAGLAWVGACRQSRRRADAPLPACVTRAWAGPGGRRAPPPVRVA